MPNGEREGGLHSVCFQNLWDRSVARNMGGAFSYNTYVGQNNGKDNQKTQQQTWCVRAGARIASEIQGRRIRITLEGKRERILVYWMHHSGKTWVGRILAVDALPAE
jgi:hypothetical protein